MKKTILITLLSFTTHLSVAQVFWPVTHTSGTQIINGNNVTVTPLNSPDTTTFCGVGSYWIGNSSKKSGYRYSFSTPVTDFRIIMTAMNIGEVISIYINGTKYNLSTNNLSSYTGTCTTGNCVIVAGDITTTSVSNNNAQSSNGRLDITSSFGVDSIRIQHINGILNGVTYNFAFNNDTTVYIQQPFYDTLLCAGDTLMLNYSVNKKFNSNNSFIGQLSDAFGSFSSPTNIDTVNSDTSGSMTWVVPSTITAGVGYRIRIIASGPVSTSLDNGKDISIVNITPVTAGSNSPVCAADTLHLTSGNSTAGVTYSWTGPVSFSANTQNTFVANSNTAATGWYVATLNLNGCLYKDSTYATVYPIPATPSASYSSPMCIGETLQLNASTVSGVNYNWTGVGNYSANTQNPIRVNAQLTDTGTYSVTTTANGCTSHAAQIKVNINPKPFVVIFPTPGDSICIGSPVSFTALSNNHGGTPTYQWRINGVLTGSTATTFSSSTLNHSDVLRVDMTEYTKCRINYVDASNEVEMKVLPWLAPSVTISASPNRPLNVDEYVTFTATPTNGGNNPRYQWKRNGQDVQGATGAVWSANTLNDNDSISVELISNYHCPQPPTASSNGIRVKVLTSAGDVKAGKQLKVYPNPNKGSFILSGKIGTDEPLQLDIINTIGQVVHHETVTTNQGELNKEIQPVDLPNGIYMLRLKTNDEINTVRFRVEK